jgi:hypothetical protein
MSEAQRSVLPDVRHRETGEAPHSVRGVSQSDCGGAFRFLARSAASLR